MIPATLDVNILISSAIAPEGNPRAVVNAWRTQRFQHVTSLHIVEEYRLKLGLPRISRRYRVPLATIESAIIALRTRTTLISIGPADVWPITGDPEDDAVLATCRLGRSAYLVTGDRGLLALGAYESTRIVTARAFLDVLERPATHPAGAGA